MAIKFGLPGIKQKPAPKQPNPLSFGQNLIKKLTKKKGMSPGLNSQLSRAKKGAGLLKSSKPKMGGAKAMRPRGGRTMNPKG